MEPFFTAHTLKYKPMDSEVGVTLLRRGTSYSGVQCLGGPFTPGDNLLHDSSLRQAVFIPQLHFHVSGDLQSPRMNWNFWHSDFEGDQIFWVVKVNKVDTEGDFYWSVIV